MCWRFLQPGSIFYLLDHPNHRSLHQQATPRSGGVAIVFTLLLSVLLAASLGILEPAPGWYFPLTGTLLLAVIGYIDDHAHVSPLARLGIQTLAALFLSTVWLLEVLVFPGFEIILGKWAAGVITIVYVVWMINLYNFMDGMDGFAGGMAVIGFTALALFGFSGGATGYAF